MSPEFEHFLATLKPTNLTLDTLVDFPKVRAQVAHLTLALHQLNYLLGKADLRLAVAELFEANPRVFAALPILLAVRSDPMPLLRVGNNEALPLDHYFTTAAGVHRYLQDSGLAELFQSGEIRHLVDYVWGVEVGLDSNARKNRVGKLMAAEVAAHFRSAGLAFAAEVPSVELPAITALGLDQKRFDFVLRTPRTTYLVETNFYNSGGSKLNEVARAYVNLAAKINGRAGYEFVWITDGPGWLRAKNKLAEAFRHIPHLYNLASLTHFIGLIQQKLQNP